MVDMAQIQTAYYMVAATGVLLAAIYYVYNMRHIAKVREMEICRYLTQFTTSEQTNQSIAIMSQLKWKDPEEFYEKYWYSNPEIYAKLNSWFFLAETLGTIVKNRLANAELVFDLGGWAFIHQWERYSACINWRRELPRQTMGRDYLGNFEFLARELEKVGERRDATFKDRLETYRRTLKS